MQKVLNWVMFLSLITVFITGLLLKGMPGMALGITHGVSGLVLTVSAAIHMLQRGMLRGRAKAAEG